MHIRALEHVSILLDLHKIDPNIDLAYSDHRMFSLGNTNASRSSSIYGRVFAALDPGTRKIWQPDPTLQPLSLPKFPPIHD